MSEQIRRFSDRRERKCDPFVEVIGHQSCIDPNVINSKYFVYYTFVTYITTNEQRPPASVLNAQQLFIRNVRCRQPNPPIYRFNNAQKTIVDLGVRFVIL